MGGAIAIASFLPCQRRAAIRIVSKQCREARVTIVTPRAAASDKAGLSRDRALTTQRCNVSMNGQNPRCGRILATRWNWPVGLLCNGTDLFLDIFWVV
jgi:hypothetical protein